MATTTIGVLVIGHFWLGYEWEAVRTMVFSALVVTQLGYSYVIRRRGTGRGPNRLLLGAVVASVVLHVGVVYLPVGQTLFETVGLAPVAWVPIVLAALVSAGAVIGTDRITRRV